jgi:hypothetical protein
MTEYMKLKYGILLNSDLSSWVFLVTGGSLNFEFFMCCLISIKPFYLEASFLIVKYKCSAFR